jgi:hypothetical protein
MRVTLGLAILATMLVLVNGAGAEECEEKITISADRAARRAAAVQYLFRGWFSSRSCQLERRC